MRMTRLWNFLNTSQDLFYPIRYWPLWIQRIALLEHKSGVQRYDLFKYFVGNGVDPVQALRMIIVADVIDGKAISGVYDAAALREMDRWRNLAVRNDRAFFDKMTYWDMHDKIKRG